MWVAFNIDARLFLLACCVLVTQIWAFPQPQSASTAATPAPTSASRACGDLIRAATIDNEYGIVNASQVFDCWTTVPFNPAVATRYVRYWNDTLQFQSSLDWLKDPPAGYQKPAVDLIAGLQQIQRTIHRGTYAGEYEFEADLQRLLYSANDNHVYVDAGLLSSFSFANPYGLTTLSLDGIALPKVYLTDDLYWNQSRSPEDTWQPSAISTINGQDVVEYLSEYASLNSMGTLGPNIDWNTLMDNPVQDILFSFTTWQGDGTFYPGDNCTYTFENGTSLFAEWLALYNNPGDTGPLETGGDFYNFFVLGFYPASYDANATVPSNDTASTPTPATSWADYSYAYPDNPIVVQDNLAITGYVTGYVIPQASLAVLSIPSFFADNEDIQSFSDTVQTFLTKSKAQGMQKVLIDLQGNQGGDILLAYNTFREFFPSIDPFAGSKRRAHPLANEMGNALTDYWNNLSTTDSAYANFSSDEWVATARLNANTGQNFSSWAEMYGPVNDGVGYFMTTERWNTSSYIFDYSALGEVDPPAPVFGSFQPAPYAPEDIVMLSDSLCSSTCSLFMEMMRYDAGVQTVVVGGRPTYGPMQTPGQSRGARFYSLLDLETDLYNLYVLDQNANVPNRSEDLSIYTVSGGISLREQVLPDDPVPLSMTFEAADCRIFWTPDTYDNFTNLWQYAADAVWSDASKCVHDSTGYSELSSKSIKTPPPHQIPAGVTYDSNGIVSHGNINKNVAVIANGDPSPDAGPFLTTPHVPRTNPYFVQFSKPQNTPGNYNPNKLPTTSPNRTPGNKPFCNPSCNKPRRVPPRRKRRGFS